ncbi:MAG TPA: bifunctional 4-hydroxy-2-oxoglutarate aldolase/2-dehydro-3-deoxy-phosphogluconate aldolase [Egibacteraceae bacterium]|nr:bifunctional 4-hydroxy-2-oxoglutarate aldolase/2-dehydro-3-deoxy-phosphogluconate aldolase [Egibacteraceae bacterium]
MFRWELTEALSKGRVIAIVRTGDAASALATGQALLDAGLPAVEVSLTVPGALEAVAQLAATAPVGALVGAGTILDAATARAAILAGAQFLVSPAVRPEVIATAARYGRPVIPGAGTAGEVVAALEAGADMVKLFPASALGLATLRALRAALPQAPLAPTGGIGVEDARQWLEAGAVAVGVGGGLSSGSPDEVRRAGEKLLGEVAGM